MKYAAFGRNENPGEKSISASKRRGEKLSTRFIAAALASLLMLYSACVQKDERARIAETVERIIRLAEKENLDGVMKYLSPDYSDFEGRDKSQARELIRSYFQERAGIVIHVLGTESQVDPQGTARVRTEVALSSGAAEVFRKLFRSFGSLYRFDLEMKKSGEEWKVVFARWRSVAPEELAPGALSILRKLFPD